MSSSLRRGTVSVLTTLAALLCFGIFAPSASASSDPYPWPHNGCTSALDRPGGFDFTHPCNQHDGCYAKHWADRKTCDDWFYNDMMDVCRKMPFNLVGNCWITAGIYRQFVGWFGQKYYDSDGEMVRISTPLPNVG